MRAGAFGILCLAVWLAVGMRAHGQSGAAAVDPAEPAETVVLLIETPYYDGLRYARRRAALIEILVRQPGVKRIVAYAIGMGDHLELWNEGASSATGGERDEPTREKQKREAVTRELEKFIHETASNPAYSMSRIVQGMSVMMSNHAVWVDKRFQSSGSDMPAEVYHLRLLTAAQEIDPTFRVQIPSTSCRSDGDWEKWRRGSLVLHQFMHFRTHHRQKVTVYSIYDPIENKKLNRSVEAFFHASLDRDGIGYGGVYYLDEPASAPEPPRSTPGGETRVCDLLIQPARDEYRQHASADQPGPTKSATPPTAPASAVRPPAQLPGPRLNPLLPAPGPRPLPPVASIDPAPAPVLIPAPAPTAVPSPAPPLTNRPAAPVQAPPAVVLPPPNRPPVAVRAPPARIPETIPLSVAAGQNISRRLVDLLGPDAAAINMQRARMTERAAPRLPGSATLSGGVFRYLSDPDGQGEHTFDIELVDATGATRRVVLVVRVDRAASASPSPSPRPSPVPSIPPPSRAGELGISVSWSGTGVELDVHVFTPEYRAASGDIAVGAAGNITRDRPGAARFQPRRQEGGTTTEKITFDRAARGSYVVAVLVRAASPTSCQRGSIVVAYGIDPAGNASYRRDSLQVGSAGSATIPIACDGSGRLVAPAFATLVEVNSQ
jgi:hypothetical protein